MTSPKQRSPWWQPHVHADRRPFLIARGAHPVGLARMVRQQRISAGGGGGPAGFAWKRGASACFATDPLRLPARDARSTCTPRPEFACKKLLAAGEERIFDFARVFRNRERGPLHHPEFTMLEWYRADEPYEELMRDCAAILLLGWPRDRRECPSWRGGAHGRSVRRARAPDRGRCVREFAGIDLLATVDAGDNRPRRIGRSGAGRPGSAWRRTTSGRTCSAVCWWSGSSRIWASAAPTILCEYPVSEAALARPKPSDPRVAERFELYACGVELANAFGELTDPAEQRRRFDAEMDEKAPRLWRALSPGRGFPGGAGPMPRGQRHRARLRPAGHAGDGREPDRAGDLDAGGRM